MSTAAPREGRDHDTLVSGAGAVAALVALTALAAQFLPQPAAAQGAAACATIANDAERLACYDNAQRAGPSPAPAPATTAAQAPATTTTPPSQRDAGKAIIPIVVVGVRTLPGRETTFTTQDGTRWVQTDASRIVGFPDTPFDAELKPGAMSSTFLVPKNGGRAVRVRRVEP